MAEIPEWSGILKFPSPTQVSFASLLEDLKLQGINEATILVLGKWGMGKSSTINSLLGERVCNITTFQADRDISVMVSRQREGFVLNIIDTPGLVDSGSVNEISLERIASFCVGKTIHAVLYVDRLDAYRVDGLDHQIIRAITSTFGPKIWDIASVVLTHANVPAPSDGRSYEEFVQDRTSQVQDLIRKEGKGAWWKFWESGQEVSVLLVENSSRVGTNELGEKILPNGEVFLVKLVEGLVDDIIRGGSGLQVTQELLEGPKKKNGGKLLIPLVILVQYFIVVKRVQRSIRRDRYFLQQFREDWEVHAEEEIDRGLRKLTVGRIQECLKEAQKK